MKIIIIGKTIKIIKNRNFKNNYNIFNKNKFQCKKINQ